MRVVLMREGRVEQVGTPLEIFQHPANVFVATFFGSPAMNVWRCSCNRSGAVTRLACPGLAFDVEGALDSRLEQGAVLVGVRPHDIALAPPGDADAVGRVEVAEPLGATTVLHVRIDGGTGPAIRVVVPADRAPAMDDTVAVRLRRDRVHLFDERTGVAAMPRG
jgi:ABC-type sugar transport system ATPase subunit